MNPLTRAFDLLTESSVALVVFIVVLVFGAIIVANLSDEQLTNTAGCNSTDTSNCGHAYNISEAGGEGMLDMSGYVGLIVLAIVFVIILSLVFLIKRQSGD